MPGLLTGLFLLLPLTGSGALLEAGLAVRDVTPQGPIWLAGYEGRSNASVSVDSPLLATGLAFRDDTGARFVIVALDNCGVSHPLTAPVLEEARTRYQLQKGEVMIVSSHTHSGPVVEGTLMPMYNLNASNETRVHEYSQFLKKQLVEVIGAALADLQPAILEYGVGRATFAMNRRIFRANKVDFGENLEGPVIWDVPVLRLLGTNNRTRAIIFGYGCHGTSIPPEGDHGYVISPEFMGYAREYIETNYPGAVALYLAGMSGDSNPSPRREFLDARRHGLELAGAVAGVLSHAMRPVLGRLKLAYEEVELPLQKPSLSVLETDERSQEHAVHKRAATYLGWVHEGREIPGSVELPLAAVGIGSDLTFIAMGGEPVVDYGLKFKRLFAAAHPWLVGYAYEVPCYIPSVRILREGGYEPETSLILYGIYGPFQPVIEDIVTRRMTALVERIKEK